MKINCFTCKYGYEDERLGIPMCHHPKRFSEDCVNFNMHEEKETEESEKPINLDDAMKELDEKIALVKQRGTWKGVDVDKYMDEVRGREPGKPVNLEEEINRYLREECSDDDEPGIHEIAEHFAEWGYLRAAEKDLALTWEDIRKIVVLFSEVSFECFDTKSANEMCEETLTRFKQYKED